MNDLTTPRPWAENAEPTPEQLAEWLAVCTDKERVDLSAALIKASQGYDRCAMLDHEGLIAAYDRTRRTLAQCEALADQLWREGVRSTGRKSYPQGTAFKQAASRLRDALRGDE